MTKRLEGDKDKDEKHDKLIDFKNPIHNQSVATLSVVVRYYYQTYAI